MHRRVGLVELVAATAALHSKLNPAFWMELAVKRQLYAVMPQAVSVWARQRGCETYYATYVGVGRPEAVLPADLDVLFIATPTQHCLIAYAMAVVWRARGARVVLAGSHARAFPHDCARFADIVVTDCDRRVVDAILSDEVRPGTIVHSTRPLADLPLVEERAPEIRAAAFVGGRQRRTSTIALISSLGCPYDCDFCSEWQTPYAAFDTDRIRHDLDVVARDYPGALIGFHDPNFGVRFDQTLSAFEERQGTGNPFVMEASLSLLNPGRLARLRDAGCLMVAPGIESWADYSKKSRTSRLSGQSKFESVSEKVRELEAYIPSVQANLILGVDADAGDAPFELSETFIRDHPRTWTNVNIPIPFGGTPFARRVAAEGRFLSALPFPFYTAPYPAFIPLHYDVLDYLRRLARLYATMVSPGLLVERLRRLRSVLACTVILARTAALRVELQEMRRLIAALETDPDMRRFHANQSSVLPAFYCQRLARRLGPLLDMLPVDAALPRHGPSECEATALRI